MSAMARLLLGFLFFAVSVIARAGDDFTIGFSVDVRNQHIGGMNGAKIIPAPTLQPSLTLSRGSCFANVWASFHLGGSMHFRKGDEIDLSGGCSVPWGSVRHDLSLAYYDLYPMRSVRGDLFGVKDTMVFPAIAGITPSLSLEWDIPENRRVLPGGFTYKAEISRDLMLGGRSSVLTLAVGGHGHAYGVQPEAVSFVRGAVAFPMKSGAATITPSIMLQWGGKKGGMADNEAMLNLSVSW